MFGWHDLTRRIIPVMRAQGEGRIVFCSSVLGLVAAPYRGAYCASKFAIEALADSLRMEFAPTGIRIVLIEPGPIASRFLEHALEAYPRNIDLEASAPSQIYRARIARLEEGGDQTFKLGPEAIAMKLVDALESRNPKPRYYVIVPTYAAALFRRLLRPKGVHMETLTRFAIPVALAAVAVVLLAGLWNMLRGGSPNTSQLLMRWRVVLQFIALCLVMAAIYLAGK